MTIAAASPAALCNSYLLTIFNQVNNNIPGFSIPDDRAGRQAAQSLNISMTGLVGFLLLSKKRGFINNVGSLLQELLETGYWLSDEVIAAARKFAEE